MYQRRCCAKSSKMRASVLKVLAVLAFLSGLVSGQSSLCTEDCGLEDYLMTFWQVQFTGDVCSYIHSTLNCFHDHHACVPSEHDIYFTIQADFVSNDCSNSPSSSPFPPEETTPPQPNTPHKCPQSYFPEGFVGTDLEAPAVQPELSTQECTMSDPQDLQHCSLYALSNLRSFTGYRTGIENCLIPGWWYLLDNSYFSVAVEGINEDLQHPHTKLARINVTFHQHQCSEEKTYVADHSLPLPTTFTDGIQTETNAPLQLMASNMSELTTIMATYINTTIVIRRHGGFLSVTLQVPGARVGFESEGLCRGCPSHSYHNLTTVSTNMITECPATFSNASFTCFTQSALVNQAEFQSIHNHTYSDGCVFDVLMAETSNIGMLLLHRAVGKDARLLPSVGSVPPRPWPIQPPGEEPSTTHSPTTSSSVSTSTSSEDRTTTAAGGSTILLIHNGSLEQPLSSLLTALLTSAALFFLLLR